MFTVEALLRALPEARCLTSSSAASTPRLLLKPALDSRASLNASSLFIALRGERFDAHAFLPEVFKKGCRAVLVSDADAVEDLPFELVLLVEDTLTALQRLAAAWRASLPHVRRVAITGSLGKTIVKELLSAMLSQRFTVHRSPGSYNSQVGVPLSLLALRPEHDIALIEAGISRPGEMARHAAMIDPDYGLLTHLSVAHPEGLPSEAITLSEKMILFASIKDPLDLILPDFVAEGLALPQRHDLKLLSARYDASRRWLIEVEIEGDPTPHSLWLDSPGEHMVQNALCAARAALMLGCDIGDIARGLASYVASPMRLEVHTTPEGVTLINDAYSADPVSSRAALDALAQHAGAQPKIAILGDMLGLGLASVLEHEQLGRYAAGVGLSRLLTVGARARGVALGAIQAGMDRAHVTSFEDLDALQHHVRERGFERRDVVLFKGSRAVGLERVARHYLESLGPTRLIIDLGAIRDNFHALRQVVGAPTRQLAVVKSFAYGNDATRVAMTLVREGVDALSVAYADEAIPLRRAGLQLPILVHNTTREDLDKILAHQLTAIVYSEAILAALDAASRARGVITPIHLEIDTGMHRVGLALGDVERFTRLLRDHEHLRLVGTMTHLAAADDSRQDAFTLEQLRRFDEALEVMRRGGLDPGLVHAANTAAAWRFPQARRDMVRVGLGLYGLDPAPDVERAHRPLRPALKLTTRVIHVHTVAAGETIGYGRAAGRASDRQIATLAIGYSDGFARALSSGRGQVLLGGERCEVVGRVCMDVCMVDVTHLGGRVQVGDEAVVIGQQGEERIEVDELARRAGTISYEILCNISSRVRRIFVQS